MNPGAAAATTTRTVASNTVPIIPSSAATSKPVSTISSAATINPNMPLVPMNSAPSLIAPSWETQKNARNFTLNIPAPRGQIVDRNGVPLAQNRVGYNLGIVFPASGGMTDVQVFRFVQKLLSSAQAIMGETITLQTDNVLKHFRNRAQLPLVIAQDLSPQQQENFRQLSPDGLLMVPVYFRHYPQGTTAAHIVGYAGRSGRFADGPIENNESLWPNTEGREGLEQTFDETLQGKPGQMNVVFDANGRKISEQIVVPPQPGGNVVTTIDLSMQQLCEKVLAKRVRRGAVVVVDPNNGDILAMASWPTFNPNVFVPSISTEKFNLLSNDPQKPLIPRAYRAAYPPGSTFKILTGLAAMQSGKIATDDEFQCPASLRIDKRSFPNWKKSHAGSLDFAGALTQSCNTWFYQVGMKIGWETMHEYATRCGVGMRTGIPLAYEAEGRMPTQEFFNKVHKRKIGNGDEANISIGQGDVELTPLQLAQAMAVVGNGGTLYQARIVQQVQNITGQIITAYNIRARSQFNITEEVMTEIRSGMMSVITSRLGTAPAASVPGVKNAGKTGTAQWRDKGKEHTAAWFSGFIPATDPKYAFAALYEGEANDDDVHGGSNAAPIIGDIMRELFPVKKKTKKKREEPEEEPMDDAPDAPPRDEEKPLMDDDGVPIRRGRVIDDSDNDQ